MHALFAIIIANCGPPPDYAERLKDSNNYTLTGAIAVVNCEESYVSATMNVICNSVGLWDPPAGRFSTGNSNYLT